MHKTCKTKKYLEVIDRANLQPYKQDNSHT